MSNVAYHIEKLQKKKKARSPGQSWELVGPELTLHGLILDMYTQKFLDFPMQSVKLYICAFIYRYHLNKIHSRINTQ